MPAPRKPPPPVDPELPPVDDEGDDREGIDGDVSGGELSEASEDSEADLDDELPTDPFLDLDIPPELDGDEEGALDPSLESVWSPDEDDAQSPTGDELGPTSLLEAELGSIATDESSDADTGEGFDDQVTPLGATELPALDAEGPESDDGRFATPLAIADESVLSASTRPYTLEFLVPDREHCAALAVGAGTVVAGSNDLFWRDPGRRSVVRLGLDGTRISSLALLGEPRTTALCVTAFGRLLRRSRSGSDVEKLVEWRRTAEALGSNAESIELCQLGAARPNSVVGRLTSGRLVRSDDLGSTFYALDQNVTALAISSTGSPVVVLSRDGARLCVSTDGGLLWQQHQLVGRAREVAAGEAPLVAANASVVVLAEPERGLVVSDDAGGSFRSVAGTGNVSACAVGLVEGRPAAFCTVYRETLDQTLVVEIDSATGAAAVVATLSVEAPDDPERSLELGRVERLAWDDGVLFAAGAFGLAALRR